MLAFTSTCGRKSADARKSATASRVYSVFYVSKPTPIKHHDFYSYASEIDFFRLRAPCWLLLALARLVGFANPRCSRPFGVICFANYATHKLASQLACSQNTTDRIPKNVFEENFLGCTHRAFIPFFTSQSPHLSSNLTKFRLHSKTSYQKLFLLIWFRFLPVSNSLAKFYLYFKTAYQVSFLLGFIYFTTYWIFLELVLFAVLALRANCKQFVLYTSAYVQLEE